MIGQSRALRIAALAMVGFPAKVLAGELGHTSRATVSISITIPTRLEAKAVALPESKRRHRSSIGALCVLTSNPGLPYSVTMIPTAENKASSLRLSADTTAVSLGWSDDAGRSYSQTLRPGQPISELPALGAKGCRGEADAVGWLIVSPSRDRKLAMTATPGPIMLLIGAE